MLGFAVAFQLLRLTSNTVSSIVFGKKFDSLTARQKYDWGIRVVSQVHAIVVVIMSIPIFFNKVLLEDTLYGFDHYPACVYTIVCGVSDAKHIGVGFVVHAVASFGVYILSFRPALQYYGSSFIMFEASTIFLNINWWLDKLGMTGSRLQFYNASILLFLYLTVRLIFGTYMSYQMFEDLKANGTQTPTPLYYFYRVSNSSIMLLSYYWFYLMINAVRKRFTPAAAAKAKKSQ
ncbi:hypothetical protein FBU59_001526 [Linderina macrospora]|uniref:Uncharacterized protein n=1 Tax=Linderina macrospora TaxID=4868 RepID=A0ACC1JDV4_9FUNG|nr:hypothetical protein FBU59_001526 [Linderina macrospora]